MPEISLKDLASWTAESADYAKSEEARCGLLSASALIAQADELETAQGRAQPSPAMSSLNFEWVDSAPDFRTIAQKIAVIARHCQGKEPEQLTEQEKIAIAFIAGAAFEISEGRLRITDEFAIVKIEDRFLVAIKSRR